MSFKKLVLVFGLLGGISLELNAVKPEYQARVKQLDREIDILSAKVKKNFSDFELKYQAGIVSGVDFIIFRDAYISDLKKFIILIEEVLNYLEPKDNADRIMLEISLNYCKETLRDCTK